MPVTPIAGGMNSGIPMNGDGGPMMTGTWWNPKTGHKFTVRDCFFQDGNFTVVTTDGQHLDYNMLQHYVQCNGENGKGIVEPPKTPIQPRKPTLPKEVQEMLVPETQPDASESLLSPEDAAIAGGLGNMFTGDGVQVAAGAPEHAMIQHHQPTAPANTDRAMIERVLKRFKLPQLNAELAWPEAPIRQLDTLVNVLGIEPQEIAQYYIDQLDMRAIQELVRSSLSKFVHEAIHAIDDMAIQSITKQEPVAVATPEPAAPTQEELDRARQESVMKQAEAVAKPIQGRHDRPQRKRRQIRDEQAE